MQLLNFIAAEGPNGRFLPSDVKEFWWGLLAFSIIFGAIWLKGVPLLKEAIAKQQADAVADATAAEQALADARARIASATAELGDANAESERIVAQAHEAAQQMQVDSAARTQQMVNEMWAKAQTDADSMRTQAVADVQSEIGLQAAGAAEEVVLKNLDATGHSSLIEDYIRGLGVSS